MKQTDTIVLKFPGGIGRDTRRARNPHQDVVFHSDRTIVRVILVPLLFVTLATVIWITASWVHKSKGTVPQMHSLLAGNVAGHDITADLDASGFIEDHSGTPGIEFLGHKLVIEKERLLLDGWERAKIPPQAKLKVVVSGYKVTVMADGSKSFHATIKR